MPTLLLGAATHERLRTRLPTTGLDCVVVDDQGTFRSAANESLAVVPPLHAAYGNEDTLMGGGARAFVAAITQAAPAIDWFQSFAAGYEHPAVQRIGAAVKRFSTCHVQSEAMAEWALWAALDTFRQGPQHRRQQAEARWQPQTSREIQGSRWLIVGFGSVGEAIGRRVRALGGFVTGVRRRGGTSADADLIRTSLGDADLSAADVIVLVVPHNNQTNKMVNALFLERLNPQALLLNLGRGGLVDEAALCKALDENKLAHAWLDVASTEPLPAESPLWRQPRITLTPHDSPHTPGTRMRQDEFFLSNLERYLAGTEPLNLVDRSEFPPPGSA
ncbi:MAG: NAD(P)-dependent oxidoreductase [Pseudomonadota bacterium]